MTVNKKKHLANNILLSLICVGQAMAALSLSLVQVRRIDSDVHPVPVLYFCGSLLLFCLFFAVSSFSGRPVTASFIMLVLMNLTALVNYYELLYHGMVLTCQDVRNFMTAFRQVGNYDFRITFPVKLILLSFLSAALILAVLYMRNVPFVKSRKAGAGALVTFAGLSWFLVFSPFFKIEDNGWSWELQYYSDSFVVGTLENIKKTIKLVNGLEGYENAEIPEEPFLPQRRPPQYPDIIMILNETYYDPEHLVTFDPDALYMENYEALDAVKGYAAVPFVGGGTNGSEYELLTGNSMAILNTETPFNDMSFSSSRNLVEYLESLGYITMAAHPATAGNYHRTTVWKELGFDSIYFKQDFKDRTFYKKRWQVSDSSAFAGFKGFYESMPEDRPRFAYLLTLQNHGGWNINDADADLVHIGKGNGLSEYDCEMMNEFLTCIKQTDDTIEEIIDYFSSQPRKAVVYMVGDHCPSFLTQLMPAEAGSRDTESEFNFRKRQTPYFIWKNYEDENDGVLPENRMIDLCALTPYALMYAGLPLSPYYYQLVKASEKAQCFTGIIADEGEHTGIGYLRTDGMAESIYAGTGHADTVRDYFYMEYNSLETEDRISALFDPPHGE